MKKRKTRPIHLLIFFAGKSAFPIKLFNIFFKLPGGKPK